MKNYAIRPLLCATLALFLFTSCGKLSRGKAESEITKNMQLPQTETAKLNKRFKKDHQFVGGFPKVCLNIGIESYSSYEKQLTQLQSDGYITLKDDEYYDECNDLYTNIILTDKGKKDLIREDNGVYEIKICSIDFGEITGIVEYKEFGAADVRYTLERTDFSEFGRQVYALSSYGGQLPMTIARLANFMKYDDGWRMGR